MKKEIYNIFECEIAKKVIDYSMILAAGLFAIVVLIGIVR